MRFNLPQIHIVNLFGGTGNILFQLAYAHRLKSRGPNTWVFVLNPGNRGKSHKFEIEGLIECCEHLSMLSKFSSTLFRYLVYLKNWRVAQLEKMPIKLSWVRLSQFLNFHTDYYQDSPNLDSIDPFFIQELIYFLEKNSKGKVGEYKLVLHLRGGDYFSHLETFGVLTDKYYKDCLSLVPDYEKSRAAIFFDTPTAVLTALQKSNDYVLLGPDLASSLDLLSSFCASKYCITANSTLSWWGALLAKSNGATVFVPKPWHKSLENDFDETNSRFGFELIEASYL